jgi:hypothetical protein
MKKICIISFGRSGSTLLIDTIQKYSSNIFSLSEILNKNYINHFDISEKGIIGKHNKYNINELSTYSNIIDYINQFITIAEDLNYKNFIFKYIIEYDIDKLTNIINILEQQDFKFIFLDRNIIDIYISDQIAKKINEYTSVDTTNIKVDINFKKLYNFLGNKTKFTNYIFNIKNIIFISYEDMFLNKSDNDIINNINNLFKKVFNDDINYLIQNKLKLMEKQNKNINILNNIDNLFIEL